MSLINMWAKLEECLASELSPFESSSNKILKVGVKPSIEQNTETANNDICMIYIDHLDFFFWFWL